MINRSFDNKAKKADLLKDSAAKNCVVKVVSSPITTKEFTSFCAERGINLEKLRTLCAKEGKAIPTDEDLKAQVIRFTGSDATVDRMGDIVNPNGWDLKNFRNNPVFLGQHNSRSAPLGLSINEFIDKDALPADKDENECKEYNLKGALVMDIFFHCLTEESKEMFLLYEAGVMKTVSVGFSPKEIREITDEKARVQLGLGYWGYLFEKQELLELSGVTIPANPNALSHTGKGASDEEIDKKIAKAVAEQMKQFSIEQPDLKAIKQDVKNLAETVFARKTVESEDVKKSEEATITREEFTEAFNGIFNNKDSH